MESNRNDTDKEFNPYEYLNEDETEETFLYVVKWLDGQYETFNVTDVRSDSNSLYMKLESGEELTIPLINVRWHSTSNIVV